MLHVIFLIDCLAFRKECFYQACDLFFNKLTLDEAPRVIPGAKLDQTYQIAFNACSGLVKAELDMLASSGSQENVTKHEESIQTTVLWIFELQRFMQPLETSQNEIELALLLGKVGIVMKHLDLLNPQPRCSLFQAGCSGFWSNTFQQS
jgi:hypothetical protein